MNIGHYNTLKVIFKGSDGFLLEGASSDERAFLPQREAAPGIVVGQELRVFVYVDADDLPVASTRTPKATVGQCAYMKVVEVNEVGAFLDWGVGKDLFVPFGEQVTRMQPGRSYTVYVYIDNTGRIAATPKVSGYLSEINRDFKVGDEVEVLIWERTDLGFKAIINHTHLGMLFDNELIGGLRSGQSTRGFIAEIRPDKKINVTLQRRGAAARDELQEKILADLRARQGESTLTDKSPPAEIFEAFGVSKKQFKRALGALYREKLIEIGDGVVRLVQ